MRKQLAIATVGVGLVLSFLPVASADASCSLAWYTLFGRCNPCYDVNDALQYLHDEYGTPPLALNCGVL